MMRRLLLALGVIALTACTPTEYAAWQQWRTVDPASADAFADGVADDLAWGRCGRWHDLAIAVGWSEAEWPTVNRLMWSESNCLHHVRNPSSASGLMQILSSWAEPCGGTPAQLFDPTFNLTCALHVRQTQGWNAWSTY